MAHLLDLNSVSFTYQGAERPALVDVDFALGQGEFVGIAGPSGAGKSTLVRAATGIVPKLLKGDFKGDVAFRGHSIAERRVSDLSGKVGTVFQDFESQLFCTNARRELAFGMENLGLDRSIMEARIKQIADRTGISHLLEREPHSLSGGQKQRLALASILCLEPDLLLADEPTTDLDPVGKGRVLAVLQALADAGQSVGLVEQDAQQLLKTDRIVILKNGSLVAEGPPADVLLDPGFCRDHGLAPPQLFDVFSRLGRPERPVTVEQAVTILARDHVRFRPPQAAAHRPAPSGEAVLSVDDVRFSYSQGAPVLNGVSLEVHAGEFIAVLGPNGSGKTTLVKLLNGLLNPMSGRVCHRGVSVEEIGTAAMGLRVGFVFQNPDEMLFAANALDEVAFGLRNFGLPEARIPDRVSETLKTVGLGGLEEKDPFTMTKGDRQKLAVASVLACEPEVMILDEPTTGLDAIEQASMMNLLTRLNQAGHTIIIVTHNMDLAAVHADRVILVIEGKIRADGTAHYIFSQPDLLNQAGLAEPPTVALGRKLGLSVVGVTDLVEALQMEIS